MLSTVVPVAESGASAQSDIGLGDDADEQVVLEHGQAPDLMFAHPLECDRDVVGRLDRDRGAGGQHPCRRGLGVEPVRHRFDDDVAVRSACP